MLDLFSQLEDLPKWLDFARVLSDYVALLALQLS